VTSNRVVVVGGGLAGITAAIALAEAGIPVTVLEARPWLGGATWSFRRRGLTIDNGQHVFPRCFTAYRELLARLGTAGSVRIQDRLDLTVLTGEGQLRLRRTGWPAPLHLARIIARYRPLTMAERLSVVPAALAMWLTDLSGPGQDGGSMADWLSRHGQGEQARRQFWDMFLVPFLNEATEHADIGTAAAVMNAVLLGRRDQADLGVPVVPLRNLHGAPAARLLAELGAEVRTSAQVTAIRREHDGRFCVQLGPGAVQEEPDQLPFDADQPDMIEAAGVVLAVPPWAAGSLVPAELSDDASSWEALKPSPVVSLHVMYSSRITRLPYAAIVGSPLRWITDRTMAAGLHAGQYLAATLPAASQYVDSPAVSLREQFLPEFTRLFPAAATARVDDFFVTRERSATFRPAPGTRAVRPDQVTKLRGLALAGAWTSTGWPDTMEGAVRSGRLAADSVLRTLGTAGSRPRSTERQRPRPAALAIDGEGLAACVPAGDTSAAHGAASVSDKPAVADLVGGECSEEAPPSEAAAVTSREYAAAADVGDGPGPAASADPRGGAPDNDRAGATSDKIDTPVDDGAAEGAAAESPQEPSAAAGAPLVAVPAVRTAATPARKRAAKTGAGTRAAGTGKSTAETGPKTATSHAEAAARP
jgi:squalene-associated FAD-dependent desaturase